MPYIAKINGKEVVNKNRVALEIIKQYIENNKSESIDFFRKKLNGKNFSGTKVIIDENEKEKFILEKGQREFEKRYFSKQGDIISLNNSFFYITSEWGSDKSGQGKYFDSLLSFASENSINVQDNEKNKKRINSEQTEAQKDLKIKNIMLYGAPGVGKTYNYKRLICMIEEGKSESEIFNTIKNKADDKDFDFSSYDTIKNEKRMEFVTFHQSYSYEDFIEGFRPNENGNIELEDGTFKLLCNRASENLKNSQLDVTEENINLDELIQKFTNYIQDSLDNEKEFFIDKKITIESINDKGSFLLGGSIKSNTQRLTIDILKRDYLDFKNGNISHCEEIKPTYESKRSFHGNARYYFFLYKKLYEFEKTLKPNIIRQQKEEKENFYIIIDEINRGNISKIFGELITLIEEDKRGKKEYEVTLPYSKDKFLIPENLYIIATMNSTDKSIATIDIALRRRFTFLKIEPKPELIKDEKAKKLMENLNSFIEKMRGEEYMLGHSYFMSDLDLEFIKKYKLQPLLEEYFYGDEKNYEDVLEILDIKENN